MRCFHGKCLLCFFLFCFVFFFCLFVFFIVFFFLLLLLLFFSGIARCYLIEWDGQNRSMLCLFKNCQLTVLFLNRNKMNKQKWSSYLSPSFQATCNVASDLRSQEFGGMKDSGDVGPDKTSQNAVSNQRLRCLPLIQQF